MPSELHVYEQGEHGFGVPRRSRADLGVADAVVRVDARARLAAAGWRRHPTTTAARRSTREPRWARGVEGQRKADLGDGTFLNPILAGDHPDPSMLKDGDDYYMTFSSFDAYPGLVVWHSRDLVNWTPIGPALRKNVGVGVGAGSRQAQRPLLHLLPRRRPVPLELRGVGRRHPRAVERSHRPEDRPHRSRARRRSRRPPLPVPERRLSACRCADDGLSVIGEPVKVYDGWPIPDVWVVEGFAQEGPKILRRGDYYYMMLAEGGTAGPPTGHMIVAARSRSIDGPWETLAAQPDRAHAGRRDEPWWSQGPRHAGGGRRRPLVDGLPRLREGLPHAGPADAARAGRVDERRLVPRAGGDPARPIAKPAGDAAGAARLRVLGRLLARAGWACSGASTPATSATRRGCAIDGDGAGAAGQGRRAGDQLAACGSSSGDRAYEIEVDIDADPGASAGLLLFYSRRLYAGPRLLGDELLHAQLRAGPSAGQAAAASASGCASACATIGTS